MESIEVLDKFQALTLGIGYFPQYKDIVLCCLASLLRETI